MAVHRRASLRSGDRAQSRRGTGRHPLADGSQNVPAFRLAYLRAHPAANPVHGAQIRRGARAQPRDEQWLAHGLVPDGPGFEARRHNKRLDLPTEHPPERQVADEYANSVRRFELHRSAAVEALLHKPWIAQHGSPDPAWAHAFAAQVFPNAPAKRIVERDLEQPLLRGVDVGVPWRHGAEHKHTRTSAQ